MLTFYNLKIKKEIKKKRRHFSNYKKFFLIIRKYYRKYLYDEMNIWMTLLICISRWDWSFRFGHFVTFLHYRIRWDGYCQSRSNYISYRFQFPFFFEFPLTPFKYSNIVSTAVWDRQTRLTIRNALIESLPVITAH